MSTTTTTTSGTSVVITGCTFRGPDDPPPAAVGVRIPAPKPFGPGPLRWEARRLDDAEELTHAG
jgi:hypothetical protein